MSIRPIIFSAESLLAIREGKKTQTRRVVRPRGCALDHKHDWEHSWVDRGGAIWGPGPYLKLAFKWTDNDHDGAERIHCPYGYPEEGARLWVKESWTRDGKAMSPMFMLRILSKLTLKIVAIRCERLHSISEDDAIAEGVECVGAYATVWDQLNADRGYPWSMNPWVWIIVFNPEESK